MTNQKQHDAIAADSISQIVQDNSSLFIANIVALKNQFSAEKNGLEETVSKLDAEIKATIQNNSKTEQKLARFEKEYASLDNEYKAITETTKMKEQEMVTKIADERKICEKLKAEIKIVSKELEKIKAENEYCKKRKEKEKMEKKDYEGKVQQMIAMEQSRENAIAQHEHAIVAAYIKLEQIKAKADPTQQRKAYELKNYELIVTLYSADIHYLENHWRTRQADRTSRWKCYRAGT